jgi:ParB-like chromosome segregation protein Spo0J
MTQSPDLSHIIEPLRHLAIPLDDCHLDPANARTGHAIDRIAASLARYGQRKPIVVNRNEGMKIEAGNGTWQAAKALGWSHIAAVIVEDDPMTAVGYGIADNRLGDLSTWDAETLAALVNGLDLDMNLPTGFDDDELAEILAELGAGLDLEPPDFKEYGEDIADDIQVCTCETCGHQHAAKKD